MLKGENVTLSSLIDSPRASQVVQFHQVQTRTDGELQAGSGHIFMISWFYVLLQ